MTRSRDIADQQKNLGGAVAPYVAGKNAVINGGFDIWQRGTSFTAGVTAAYTADRWQAYQGTATAITYSRQATNDTTNLPNIQYCTRIQRTNGSTSTSQSNFAQSFETVNSIPYAGKTLTFSFYGRVGANYSHSGGTINLLFGTGTGTDQNWFSGFTGIAYQFAGWTGTSTWQRFTATVTVPTNATQIGFSFYFTPTGTAGANDYFEITGVQLELGAQSTPFSRAGGSIGGELALCQRYYWRSPFESTYAWIGSGLASSTTVARIAIPLPVPMRVQPTTMDYVSGLRFIVYDFVNANFCAGTQFALEQGYLSTRKMAVISISSMSGLTQFRFYMFNLGGSGDSSDYIGFGAEL